MSANAHALARLDHSSFLAYKKLTAVGQSAEIQLDAAVLTACANFS